MQELRVWSWLVELWCHFAPWPIARTTVGQELLLTILSHTFLRDRWTDCYNFWIWSQDTWTMQGLRVWSWLDEFSLREVVFELSCSLFWNQNDTLSFPRTYFAFRPVWVWLSLHPMYYKLASDENASKKIERCQLIAFDCSERPKPAVEPKSATSAGMPRLVSRIPRQHW